MENSAMYTLSTNELIFMSTKTAERHVQVSQVTSLLADTSHTNTNCMSQHCYKNAEWKSASLTLLENKYKDSQCLTIICLVQS